jgi:transcriptional regulator with XRE-family HTH domain
VTAKRGAAARSPLGAAGMMRDEDADNAPRRPDRDTDRMPARTNRATAAATRARLIRFEIGREIHDGRIAAGISQATAGAAVGMSKNQFGRIERAELAHVTVDQLCRAGAAIGCAIVVRAYPDREPVRDAAHLALIGRFVAALGAGIRVRREVATGPPPDQRAWDLVLASGVGRLACEAETRIRDVQALDRAIGLKQRDSGMDRVVLVVNDTAANRTTLRLHRDALRARFPLDGRAVLRRLREGLLPDSSGIVVI